MRPRRFGTACSAALAVSAFAGAQTTWYVDDDNCPGPGSGTEADPFCSIQFAAEQAADGDEIVVAAGEYFESVNLLNKAVTLRGSDGPAATVIDAQGSGTVVVGAGAAVLRWLTMTGGSAENGGGLFNSSGNPVLIGCTFVHNSADRGGALFSDAGTVTLVDCSFISNVAGWGGALRLIGGDAVLDRCTFINNSVGFNGGGIFATHCHLELTDCILSGNDAVTGGAIDVSNGATKVNGCQLFGNSATGPGGAVYENQNLQFEMTNCDVGFNSSPSGAGLLVSSPTSRLVNCTVAGSLGHGALVSTPSLGVTLSNCIFWNNSLGAIGGLNPAPTVTFSDMEGGWPGPGSNNIDADPQFTPDLAGAWTSDPVYDADTDLTVLTDGGASLVPGGLVGRQIIPDTSLEPVQTVVLANTATTITLIGELWSVIVSTGDRYAIRETRLSPDSPCIDAADNAAVPEGVTTDLDGNPRFLEIPETPDTGNGTAPIVDMGAYEALGGGCLAITSLQTICHGEGSTFTVNVEGLNACTGGTTMATFTGSGGAVGEDFCATLIINTEQGGFCCSTQVCVPVPDCSPSPPPCDIDGDYQIGVTDFLVMLGAWGPNPGHPADLDGDGAVGVTDFLDLLSNWGPCP